MVADSALLGLYPALRRFAAVVGPDEVDPDDLVHDALVATLSRTSWEELDNPVAYIRAAMLNLASNHRRSLGRRRDALGRLTRSLAGGRSDAYPSDLDELSGLTPTTRAVIYLHHIEGCSYAEIGEVLGLTEPHARVVGSRGLRKLRRQLKEER